MKTNKIHITAINPGEYVIKSDRLRTDTYYAFKKFAADNGLDYKIEFTNEKIIVKNE